MFTSTSKFSLNVSFIMLFLFLIVLSGAAQAASDRAQITVKGRVLANTCTFDASGSTLNPVLPDIADKDIKGVGKTGGMTKVKISLKDCGADTKSVSVTASGMSGNKSDSAVFGNTSKNAGAATGVGLFFYQSNTGSDKFEPAGTVTKVYPLNPGQDNALEFRAAYVGTSNSVTAGDFQTVVTLSMTYQ